MEYLAYSLMDSAYADTTVEEGFNLPEFQFTLNWKKPFKSAWLTYASIGSLFAILAQTQVASAAYSGPGTYYVRTNGSCLNLRTGPATYCPRVACYRNGSRLPRVRGYRNGFARLSNGYYASATWIGRRPGSGYTPGLGVGNRISRPRYRVLSLGSQGSDVARVQQILGISPSGYYGTATQRAVRNFQQSNGIYPADGRVGQETRRVLNLYATTGYPSGNYDYDFNYSDSNRDRYGSDYAYNDYSDSNRDRDDSDYAYNDYSNSNRDRDDSDYNYRDYNTSGREVLSRGDRGNTVRQVQIALGIRPTGNYNLATERAVRNFQARYNLPVTGVVDSETRLLLGVM
ncbi:hypothetical protein NUACC21_75840 [Scytonema sp. NUACC21]